MTQSEEFFIELAKQIPEVRLSKMFGSPCLKTPNGKSGAMLWKDDLVVKLSENQLGKALSLEGTRFFEPMEGKLMKEWVQIPFTHKARWKEFALISIQSVSKIVKKPKNK